MEDMYVKPGNQERGWNDPPQFSYGLQMARGPQRSLLNRRAVPAADSDSCLLQSHGPTSSQRSPASTRPSLSSSYRLGRISPSSGDSQRSRCVVMWQKRLRLLEDSWKGGKLSLPVRRRMDTLSQELRAGHWDAADKVHLSLMVDHVTEVSQWMVGVKRLIAETRKLNPELLEPLKKSEAQAS
ncbi:unnamed protein product, partial [Tetraodon nigroviridis]